MIAINFPCTNMKHRYLQTISNDHVNCLHFLGLYGWRGAPT